MQLGCCVAKKWTTYLCPKVEKQLQKSIEIGRHWDVNRSSDNLFEVQVEYSFVIDLHQHTCSCINGKLKVSHVPMLLQPS